MKILVVEDHPDLGPMIRDELNRAGFVTDLSQCGNEAIASLRSNHYDALILDLGLPDMDGMALLSMQLGVGNSGIPCLVLTARDGLDSRVDALNHGADDYILKPFHMPELEARLRAVLRRPGLRHQQTLEFGDWSFDPKNRSLMVSGITLTLARREATLIETLLQAAPRVVIKDNLEEALYGMDDCASINAVEALISRTRRKLKSINSQCKIETLHGIGYRLAV